MRGDAENGFPGLLQRRLRICQGRRGAWAKGVSLQREVGSNAFRLRIRRCKGLGTEEASTLHSSKAETGPLESIV